MAEPDYPTFFPSAMIDYNLKDVTNHSFAELMNIIPVKLPRTPHETVLFQSTSSPFQPMKGVSGVFGGHVLGQVVVAAARTSDESTVAHSLHGYFLRRAEVDLPFIYAVETLRDGGRYQSRGVKVFQCPEPEIKDFDFQSKYLRFVSMVSLKRPQDGYFDYQAPFPEQYNKSDAEIAKLEEANDYDALTILEFAKKNGIPPQWHPIDVRKYDPREQNLEKEALSDRRMIHFFKSSFKLPADPNMHVALLLYISDRNSLFTLLNIQDDPRLMVHQLASIDHTFVLHRLDPVVDDGYLLMETWSDSAVDARGLYNGRIYDQNKRLIASFMQDGLVQVSPETPENKL